MKTKSYTAITSSDAIMTGEERFPIMNSIFPGEVSEKIQTEFKGLKLHWDCIKKACIVYENVKDISPKCCIVIGTLDVYSDDFKSSYGFDYIPPLQFHAWVETIERNIIDFSLPGVILKGLNTSDSYGKMLKGREPFIYAGQVDELRWVDYTKHCIYGQDSNMKISSFEG